MSGVSIRTPLKKSWTSCIIKSSRKLCSGFPGKERVFKTNTTRFVFWSFKECPFHCESNGTLDVGVPWNEEFEDGDACWENSYHGRKSAQKHGVGLCFVYFTDIFDSRTWLFQQNGTNKGTHKCLWLSAFSKGTFFPVPKQLRWSAYCHIMVQLQEYRVKSCRDSPWTRDPAKWPNGRSQGGVNKHQVLNP